MIFAFDDGELNTHSRVLLLNPDHGHETVYGDKDKKVIETTVGRVVFSEIWPTELGFPTVLSEGPNWRSDLELLQGLRSSGNGADS